jgi:hypothetical protein
VSDAANVAGSHDLHPRIRFTTTDELRELVDAFERCTLSRAEWTHAAHLSVAVWYVMWCGTAEALERMRAGIQRLNAVHNVPTTPTGGYHETITRFYVWLVSRELRRAHIDAPLAEITNAVVDACDDRTIPLRYYSRDRLMSWEARTTWIEPDLRPLDVVTDVTL